MPTATWTLPAQPISVRQARRAVAAFADEHAVPEPPLEDLKLAVTEAVTNAILHAFGDSGPGTVTIVLQVQPASAVVLSVTDDGRGMRPRVDSPGLGVGLAVMNALADSTEVRSSPDEGTEVRMTFVLTG